MSYICSSAFMRTTRNISDEIYREVKDLVNDWLAAANAENDSGTALVHSSQVSRVTP